MKERSRLVGVDARLVAVSLPGEFPGSARTREYPAPDGDDVIKILSVGTIEPRKNQITMIKAFLKARADAGPPGPADAGWLCAICRSRTEIEGYVDRNAAVTWIGEVDDERLSELYLSCHFTIYPSLGEGFGLPVVESSGMEGRDVPGSRRPGRDSGRGLCPRRYRRRGAARRGHRRLINDDAERGRLGREAMARTFKTWQAYGREVLTVLSTDAIAPRLARSVSEEAPRLRSPLLSICVTTYNRAAWLEVSLRQLAERCSLSGRGRAGGVRQRLVGRHGGGRRTIPGRAGSPVLPESGERGDAGESAGDRAPCPRPLRVDSRGR